MAGAGQAGLQRAIQPLQGNPVKSRAFNAFNDTTLETPVASAPSTTKRTTARKTTRAAEAKPLAAPEKAQIKTTLIASCGWPTDAALPERRRPAKR